MLLTSQKNEILRQIERYDFDPNDFEWTHGGKGFVSDGRVKLIHKPTGFNIILAITDDGLGDQIRETWYTPGRETEEEYENATTWAIQLTHIRNWLINLNREYTTPDLWAKLLNEAILKKSTQSTEESNTKFSPSEVQQVHEKLIEIKKHLLEIHAFKEDEKDILDRRFDNIDDALSKLNRTQWKDLFIGALLGIIADFGLKPITRDILGFSETVLSELFEKIFLIR